MSRSEKFEEIRALADAVCDEEVTPEQMAQLELFLSESDEARKFYLEYVGIHARMKSKTSPQFELILRRLQVDEVIFRPTGLGGGSIPPDQLIPTDREPRKITGKIIKKGNKTVYLFCFACLLIVGVVTYYLGKGRGESVASLLEGSLIHEEKGLLKDQGIGPGVYTVRENAHLRFESGDIVHISEKSCFELKNKNEIILLMGQIHRKNASSRRFIISAGQFSLKSSDADFVVTMNKEASKIKTSSSQVCLTPKRWRPRHFWNFDSKHDRALDSTGEAHGVIGQTTIRSPGLVGDGSFTFHDLETDFIDVGSGGGTALATGSFSVVDGVTVEALFKTNWSSDIFNYDEIFRKDQDGNLRMLLSFQNDFSGKAGKMTMPAVKPGPVLSFGLFLVGQGYHELELVLDGLDGRPTLAALKAQSKTHIVASYDVSSGIKALYLNGKRLVFYQYPPGTKMLSGGPGKATIGNSPNGYKEPFNGVIDEVAFYDFALPAFMVDYHFKLTNSNKNYFDLSVEEKLPQEIEILLPKSSQINIDPLTGLPN